MARVVIVGAGLGGLASAVRLADFGHAVTVIEQALVVGGQVGTFTRSGFTFDTGPTTLTLPAVYRDLFRKTGRRLERELELSPVEPAWRYAFPDGLAVDLPNASRATTARALDQAFGPGSGRQWDAMLRRGERMWAALRRHFVEAPPTVADVVRLVTRPGDVRAVWPGRSLRDLGRRSSGDARLQTMIEGLSGCADPRRTPATVAVIPYLEHTSGTWYVRGGMRRLVDAVHDRAVLLGVTVRTSATAAHVVVSGGRATGVRLVDGLVVPADVVVANAHAATVFGELVGPSAGGRERRRAQRHVRAAASWFSVLLALRGRTAPPLPHRSVVFPERPEAELDAVFGATARPADDPTVWIDAPDDPALRPSADTENWIVRVRVPQHGASGPGTVDWTAPGLAESYADRVLSVLASRGLDVRHRVIWRVLRTPADLQRETRSPGGVVAWAGPSAPGSMLRRPANRSSLKGLFLVGASTQPGGGVPFVGLSAAAVADLVGRA